MICDRALIANERSPIRSSYHLIADRSCFVLNNVSFLSIDFDTYSLTTSDTFRSYSYYERMNTTKRKTLSEFVGLNVLILAVIAIVIAGVGLRSKNAKSNDESITTTIAQEQDNASTTVTQTYITYLQRTAE